MRFADHTFVNAWLERSRALVRLKHLDSAGASFAMARYLEPQCGAGPTPDWARQYSYLWSAPPRTPRLGAQRVAVCLTGSCEVLQYTSHNLRSNLFDFLPDYDLFVAARDDGHADRAERLKPTELVVVQEDAVVETPFQLAHARNTNDPSHQATLQHLLELKQVGQLMNAKHANYDAVVYVTTSAWLKNRFPDVSRLDLSVVHTPWDLRGGINDRFAVGAEGYEPLFQSARRLSETPRLVGDGPRTWPVTTSHSIRSVADLGPTARNA